MELAQLIVLVLKASIILIVLSLGLKATVGDATYLFRRPGLLLRSLLAMQVIMPLLAAALAAAFDLKAPVKAALLLLSVAPVPPVLPNKQVKAGGSKSYIYGLLVAASLLAVGLVPLMVRLLGLLFNRETYIAPATVALIVLINILVPLAVGIVVRRLAPALAERAAPIISGLGNVLMIAAVIPVLVTAWPAIASLVGDGTLLAIAAFVVSGLAVGHLLGGPEEDDRAVLALATATRHPGIAIAIAGANLAGNKLVPAAILLSLLVNALLSIPYLAWVQRRHAGDTGAAAAK